MSALLLLVALSVRLENWQFFLSCWLCKQSGVFSELYSHKAPAVFVVPTALSLMHWSSLRHAGLENAAKRTLQLGNQDDGKVFSGSLRGRFQHFPALSSGCAYCWRTWVLWIVITWAFISIPTLWLQWVPEHPECFLPCVQSWNAQYCKQTRREGWSSKVSPKNGPLINLIS